MYQRRINYLEDFAAGQKYSGRARVRVEAGGIKAFAAEFDPQPFHLDDAAAQSSIFRGLAAGGWHTAAMTMRLLVASDLQPVRPGDELHVEVEVLKCGRRNRAPDRGVSA